MAVTVKATVNQLAPIGGTSNNGFKIGFLDSVTKATINDVVVVGNAQVIEWAILSIDADGSEETVTLSTNQITLLDATTGAVSGLIVYR